MKTNLEKTLYKTIKFIFDRLIALFGLLLLSPLLFLLALMVYFELPNSSVIYKQKRVGLNGSIFTMYKFRSMYPNHYESTISIAGENRITPFGTFLRKYKLDELPELWNVVKGEMSLVGPRPDVPGYADKLKGNDKLILSVRPGITGPASLKYSHEEELLANQTNPVLYNDEVIFPDKVRINLFYIQNMSIWFDIKVIALTILGKKLKEIEYN